MRVTPSQTIASCMVTIMIFFIAASNISGNEGEPALEQKPQNIFLIADNLQKSYEEFVRSFQHFQNPKIQKWVDEQMEKEDLLYKDPLIELNFQFEKGKLLDEMGTSQKVKDFIRNDCKFKIFVCENKLEAEALEHFAIWVIKPKFNEHIYLKPV